ncbi:uncharacterized protein LOC126745964 [Anthonomus grandis grandis]|uniref:uncharacterized protein LOC126745964 n=1 Tax=Anthonomus grandis grandis TaxID=2921223 RepID=UPI0021667EE6|nr:uncharacterized protein LOC126745964 [Anthonomus grandis grandis]
MPSCASGVILVCFIGLVAGRPQDNQPAQESRTEHSQVELERQYVRDVTPIFFPTEERPPAYPQIAQRKVQENTKEILDKIAEVNKKQGLTQKKFKPNYFHFPFSYSRSKSDENNFKFSRDPFSNPILDYVENRDTPRFRTPYLEKNNEYNGGSFTDTNPEILPEDHIPGQQIKRKITHYQSFVIPNPYMMGPQINPMNMNPFSNQAAPNPETQPADTINNIKQILSGNLQPPSQASPSPLQTVPNNPYQGLMEQQFAMQQLFGANPWTTEQQKNQLNQQNYLQQMFGAVAPNKPADVPNPVKEPNKGTHSINEQQAYLRYLLAMKNPQDNQIKARQNWNWPGANWFPIYIRDPFLQMYYAVTNMIEYGPNSGNEGPCKLTPRPQGSRVKPGPKTASSDATHNTDQVTVEVNKRDGEDDIQIVKLSDPLVDNTRYLDVEDIDLGDDDLVKFTINLPNSDPPTSGGRKLKDNLKTEKMRWEEYIKLRNDTTLSHLIADKLNLAPTVPIESKQAPQPSPVIKEPELHVEELEDTVPEESEKAEDISIANQGSRKVFSKDNTGNGIFIHKLKVRKGGVAIAGPGGIATAGSGGTAIVGPNGIAYTHPNGLAIAGSGTKVVAVDPKVDLNEVIKDSVQNGTHQVNTRVGKVVAVGPVVYYNRGDLRYPYQAWLPYSSLPLLQLGNPTTTSHVEPLAFQINRFPKYHALSSPKVLEEYRQLLKKLDLQEPRHFFTAAQNKDVKKLNLVNIVKDPKTVINRPIEEQRNFQPTKAPSLAPHRLSPLLTYIKNKNTLEQDKIIRFRTSNVITEDDITTLILKPQSTAVAGVEGKAVSNPLSRAILRRGVNADILFEPQAVAVAGPGGIAHATRITLVPFYGGAKGQSLQIIEGPNGEVLSTVIIKTPSTLPAPSQETEIEINPLDLENPPLPSKFDTEYYEGYDEYIRNIRNKAGKIIQLQEIAKRNGNLDEQQEIMYQEYMASINQSAKKLAEAQENAGLGFENREGLSQWFERKSNNQSNKNKKKEDEKQKKKKEEDEKRKKQEEEERKKKKQEEEKKKQEEEENEGGEEVGGDDGVAINLPPPEASVAEAKPVGLAVAGEGGVAASKPIATAVVGPGGLAIARPVGTAIAGVSPDQALVPIYVEGGHKKTGSKKTDQMNEFLNKIISKYHQT